MSYRVLLVEDERLMRTILRDNLEFEGYEVFAVETGEQGLAIARDMTPDVLLLDVMLPGISGYEVCRRIRASGSQVPIILVTARNTAADRRAGAAVGADEYVAKPFNVPDLVNLIGLCVSRTAPQGGARTAQGS